MSCQGRERDQAGCRADFREGGSKVSPAEDPEGEEGRASPGFEAHPNLGQAENIQKRSMNVSLHKHQAREECRDTDPTAAGICSITFEEVMWALPQLVCMWGSHTENITPPGMQATERAQCSCLYGQNLM